MLQLTALAKISKQKERTLLESEVHFDTYPPPPPPKKRKLTFSIWTWDFCIKFKSYPLEETPVKTSDFQLGLHFCIRFGLDTLSPSLHLLKIKT